MTGHMSCALCMRKRGALRLHGFNLLPHTPLLFGLVLSHSHRLDPSYLDTDCVNFLMYVGGVPGLPDQRPVSRHKDFIDCLQTINCCTIIYYGPPPLFAD